MGSFDVSLVQKGCSTSDQTGWGGHRGLASRCGGRHTSSEGNLTGSSGRNLLVHIGGGVDTVPEDVGSGIRADGGPRGWDGLGGVAIALGAGVGVTVAGGIVGNAGDNAVDWDDGKGAQWVPLAQAADSGTQLAVVLGDKAGQLGLQQKAPDDESLQGCILTHATCIALIDSQVAACHAQTERSNVHAGSETSDLTLMGKRILGCNVRICMNQNMPRIDMAD